VVGTIKESDGVDGSAWKSRQEAKRVLDDVRTRYGILPLDQRTYVAMPPAITKASGQRPPARPLDLRQSISESAREQVQAISKEPPLDLGWISYASSSSNTPDADKERDSFHYLIRIAECTLTLHCEIYAANAAEARRQLGKIRNLLEWREISAQELAEVTRNSQRSPTDMRAACQAEVSDGAADPGAASLFEDW
jgi:hypothetical protein